MKPKILGYYLRNEIRTGGHKRYLELLNSLALKGWDVTVFLGNTIEADGFSFNVIPLPPVSKGKIPFSIKQMFLLLPEIIKIKGGNWITIAFGETNYLTMKIAKMFLKAKVVFAFRSNSYKAKKDEISAYNHKANIKQKIELIKMLKVENKITKLSDLLLFQTDYDRDDINKRTKFPIGKSVIIPNSVKESWFEEKYKNNNCSSSLKKIIYLGSYDYRKGTKFLLEALSILKEDSISPEVHFFGYGREKAELEAYVRNNKLRNVVINDKLTSPMEHLGAYDLMVVPSIYDSYPNVILESIFTGTPVIASDNSGMKAILEYDELLFKTGAPKDIANKIKKIYNSVDYYKKIKNLCNIRLEKHNFIWPDKFEEAILKVLEVE